MGIASHIGRMVSRHMFATGGLVLGAGVLLMTYVLDMPAPQAPPISQISLQVEQAQTSRLAALKLQCAEESAALVSTVKKALAAAELSNAQQLLAPCKTVTAGLDVQALIKKVDAASSEQALRIAAANAKAEKAKRKKEGVSIGMTKQEVLDSSWGRPQKINTTTTAAGTREQWVYGNGGYLYFRDNQLTTIQN